MNKQSEKLKVKGEKYKICATDFEGITLVALVITIIVLIILAAVSINAVMNQGLIKNAKEAKIAHENATKKEQTSLSDLEQEIENVKGNWKEYTGEDGKQYVTNGTTTLEIGTTTSYSLSDNITDYKISGNKSGTGEEQTITADTFKNLTWNVAGVNKHGKLELVANNSVVLDLIGKVGYDNGPEIISDLEKHLSNSVTDASTFKWATDTNVICKSKFIDLVELEGVLVGFPTRDTDGDVQCYTGKIYGVEEYWVGIYSGGPYIDFTPMYYKCGTFSEHGDCLNNEYLDAEGYHHFGTTGTDILFVVTLGSDASL